MKRYPHGALSAIMTVLFMLMAASCFGMGGMGANGAVNKIPEPDRPFTVRIVDESDTSFDVDKFSVEGVTYIPAKMGKADIGIDFAQVRKVLFRHDGDKVSADITFKNGDTRKLGVDPATNFYGVSAWGKMRLQAKDMKEIEFR